MKTNKYLILIYLIFSIYIRNTFSQEYKIPVENTKDYKLLLEDFTDNLSVEGYKGKEIIFTRTDKYRDSDSTQPGHSKGSKPVYIGGTDNSTIGLHMEKDGNRITVTCLPSINKKHEYKVKVPDMLSLKIQSSCERSNDVSVSDLNNDIEIKNCQSINLKNINGSVIISTVSGNVLINNCVLDKDATISVSSISGNINAILKQVTTTEPISFNAISGDIDITLPLKIQANIHLKSISGNVKSDFDFSDKGKNTNQIIGTTINNQINGGGVEVKLSTVSGNINLRKGRQ